MFEVMLLRVAGRPGPRGGRGERARRPRDGRDGGVLEAMVRGEPGDVIARVGRALGAAGLDGLGRRGFFWVLHGTSVPRDSYGARADRRRGHTDRVKRTPAARGARRLTTVTQHVPSLLTAEPQGRPTSSAGK